MKSGKTIIIPGFVLSILLATILACGGTPTPPPATATPNLPPTQTSLPTQTPVPLYQLVTLASVPRNETGQAPAPAYTLKARIPVLQGSDDPRVTNFNNEMGLLTQEEIAKFKDNVAQTRPLPGSSGSSYDQQYKLLSPPGNLVSLKFQIQIYIYESAHPNTHSRTVNYDLEAGADVRLEQLFLPGSDYLVRIANYCIAKLKSRNIGFESFSSGAQPSPANYGNWNITTDGLLITFDEYQVAAYAAGPQEVVVPYAEIQSDIDLHGPLAGFLP
jgi:hypothetical protein